MFDCRCFHWKQIADFSPPRPETFSLPAPMPQWPRGQGFGTGKITLGEIEVVKITKFEFIWIYNLQDRKKGVAFYKPIGIPDGFCSLGHYCQFNDQPLRGFALVAREVAFREPQNSSIWNRDHSPALLKPLDYTLIWSSDNGIERNLGGCGYFWLPQPPEGYKAVGFLVTDKPDKPELAEVRCVRADLTDKCESYRLILDTNSKVPKLSFRIWNTRPSDQGMCGTGVPLGTFFCSSHWDSEEELNIACLKNLSPALHAMPSLDQIHALIRHYGPMVFFHPDEVYRPSSVSWFFKHGALLYRSGRSVGEPIDAEGSNLPCGGENDGTYWIDLPCDDRKEIVKQGNLESATLYVHVKPALGGTFTDIAMWVFCPFNGPATLKVGIMNVSLSKIGQHVCDWEHFTLRISNFTGELWGIYFSQHSGGEWVDAFNLEFIEGNKAIVYSSKNGHASFPHPGSYIQGSAKLGIGIRNDATRSNHYVDSSNRYEIIAAEYLGNGVVSEPCWLQYMRKWGPTVVYDSRAELDKIINRLPLIIRYSVENMFGKFPVELYGEDGPTGPKEKDNWVGDERS
ncbi:Vacuolar protein sorting-associated protein [Actinidia chinensis var. chinensis]|uniref:Vacuolar protein sorting-associated protein n=1 Tax=Actinidia chinensis var. chinensis TaxID=1590841 RepID=A0A2R6PE96_ACTCC|nr:Vacuolar protein sorting-associated protein [Actinidia chinensis var. chinensis]